MVEDTQEPKTGTAVDSSELETPEVDATESEAAGADTPETPEAVTPEAEVADEAARDRRGGDGGAGPERPTLGGECQAQANDGLCELPAVLAARVQPGSWH